MQQGVVVQASQQSEMSEHENTAAGSDEALVMPRLERKDTSERTEMMSDGRSPSPPTLQHKDVVADDSPLVNLCHDDSEEVDSEKLTSGNDVFLGRSLGGSSADGSTITALRQTADVGVADSNDDTLRNGFSESELSIDGSSPAAVMSDDDNSTVIGQLFDTVATTAEAADSVQRDDESRSSQLLPADESRSRDSVSSLKSECGCLSGNSLSAVTTTATTMLSRLLSDMPSTACIVTESNDCVAQSVVSLLDTDDVRSQTGSQLTFVSVARYSSSMPAADSVYASGCQHLQVASPLMTTVQSPAVEASSDTSAAPHSIKSLPGAGVVAAVSPGSVCAMSSHSFDSSPAAESPASHQPVVSPTWSGTGQGVSPLGGSNVPVASPSQIVAGRGVSPLGRPSSAAVMSASSALQHASMTSAFSCSPPDGGLPFHFATNVAVPVTVTTYANAPSPTPRNLQLLSSSSGSSRLYQAVVSTGTNAVRRHAAITHHQLASSSGRLQYCGMLPSPPPGSLIDQRFADAPPLDHLFSTGGSGRQTAAVSHGLPSDCSLVQLQHLTNRLTDESIQIPYTMSYGVSSSSQLLNKPNVFGMPDMVSVRHRDDKKSAASSVPFGAHGAGYNMMGMFHTQPQPVPRSTFPLNYQQYLANAGFLGHSASQLPVQMMSFGSASGRSTSLQSSQRPNAASHTYSSHDYSRVPSDAFTDLPH